MPIKTVSEKELLLATIKDALMEKKGQDIVDIDLTQLENPVCDNFLICHADSVTQVQTLASWVEEHVFRTLGKKVWRVQGLENSQWVLVIYDEVIVHIFLKEFRDFYRLEDLWADGRMTRCEDALKTINNKKKNDSK